MENKKKKFSETKVGQLLGGLAGKVLPDSGILGVVKNLIDNDSFAGSCSVYETFGVSSTSVTADTGDITLERSAAIATQIVASRRRKGWSQGCIGSLRVGNGPLPSHRVAPDPT